LRILCFCVVTLLQISIILTANYAFLNYIVLALGILLLDDRLLVNFLPERCVKTVRANLKQSPPAQEEEIVELHLSTGAPANAGDPSAHPPDATVPPTRPPWAREIASAVNLWLAA